MTECTLAELEAEVACRVATFGDGELGALLAEIRDRRLWEPEHVSFAAYMAKRWGPGSPGGGMKLTAVFHDGGLLWEDRRL